MTLNQVIKYDNVGQGETARLIFGRSLLRSPPVSAHRVFLYDFARNTDCYDPVPGKFFAMVSLNPIRDPSAGRPFDLSVDTAYFR